MGFDPLTDEFDPGADDEIPFDPFPQEVALVAGEPHVGPGTFDNERPVRGVLDDRSGLQDGSDVAVSFEEGQGIFQGRGRRRGSLPAARGGGEQGHQEEGEPQGFLSAERASAHGRMIVVRPGTVKGDLLGGTVPLTGTPGPGTRTKGTGPLFLPFF